MWILFIIELIMIAVFILIGWAIKKKKAYWLISGFSSRSKEEQEELIKNGLPQKTGTLMYIIGIEMLILLPLIFTPFKYVMEIQFGLMFATMMGGLIYLSRYEIPRKRKQSYIISIRLTIFLFIILGGLAYLGYQGFDLTVKENSFEISGIYGDKWNIDDIKGIELMERMPEVTVRQNGFGLSDVSKGYFKVKGYGKSLIFIEHGHSPYLYLHLHENRHIFINNKDPRITEQWYKELKEKLK